MKLINPLNDELDFTPDSWRIILASLALGLCIVSIFFACVGFIISETSFLDECFRALVVGVSFILLASVKLK